MISQKLEKLYREYRVMWGDDYTHNMVPCGLVDEDAYLASKPRIVFVLKEPHGHPGLSIPDLLRKKIERNDLKLGGAGPTWIQAGVWAYAIHNGFGGYRELRQRHFVAAGIRTIGMTNLKKTAGGPTAIPGRVKEAAVNEYPLWRKELVIMNPNLMICGRTYSNVILNLRNDYPIENKQILPAIDGKIYHYALCNFGNHDCVILQFDHPAKRGNRQRTLDTLGLLITRLRGQQILIDLK